MKFKLGNIQVFPHNYFFDFMKWRKYTVGISIVLILFSLFIIFNKGINYSIDFLGGAEIETVIKEKDLTREKVEKLLTQKQIENFEIVKKATASDSESAFIIRLQRKKGENEKQTTAEANNIIQMLFKNFKKENVTVSSVTNISGKIGKEEETKGYLALALACIGILIYIGFRFDTRFAPGAVLCLIHNVIVALGVMTFLGKPFTTSSIAAFLTIVGYTINDTVIVYDRIREIRSKEPSLKMTDIVNKGISQTMNRTILTSATTLCALSILSIIGIGSIENFAITMLIGVIVGTYSSIYIAAPLTLMMDKFLTKIGFRKKKTYFESENQKKERDDNFAPPIYIRKKDK